ncbi:hypothetical protein [[Enterobacter] lignolyticus]|uniref:Tail Collar domain protein n=1 Tax=[Enterobacter] lignolyticus TaxID=1334193 RepID=A0A806XAY0_9ENTR|nr:hypothetical protein [[Enterobacter] lignolyticus]ALR75851.1 hypothetical protein AO703_05900 [[Enterobacter] lignolyticus]
MLRIGQVEPTATSDGKYTDGNVAGGTPATRLRAPAFNAMQEELANIVESATMTLDPNDMTQVLTALKKLLLSRANPFGDIKSDGPAAIATALANLGLGEMPIIAKYGSALIGELVHWPMQQMPQEIWTDMKMEFIPYMGQSFDGSRYPLLAQLHPSLQLPADMRGEFVRGWDNGKGTDPSRALMSAQTDAFRAHTHTAVGMIYSYGWAANGPGKDYGNGTVTTSSTGGTETRPVNVAWNFIVRAK